VGLGENIVQGTITPDEWMILSPQNPDLNPMLKKQCGRKEFTMIYSDTSKVISRKHHRKYRNNFGKQNQFP
jgi:pyruvate,water dikinase